MSVYSSLAAPTLMNVVVVFQQVLSAKAVWCRVTLTLRARVSWVRFAAIAAERFGVDWLKFMVVLDSFVVPDRQTMSRLVLAGVSFF